MAVIKRNIIKTQAKGKAHGKSALKLSESFMLING